ncbi:hypothetical protein SPI_08975 [Niveomyces insectorum RCEF 264]|uniref:Uncharacterized protein n=1 Tax=Niveomyces insectorum RCEF 264 TaxID=1081102 RepID=A0A167MHB7_9HYPO|nr:hypothetical protein SPI_08975 [Niveomyces insectorum RCEF 264]
MSTTMKLDLHQILTPTLLINVHELQYPWAKGSILNFSHVGYHLHTGEHDNDDDWKAACLESAIRPILTIGVENLPTDLLQFLPPPESPDFPVLYSGLILLFDQASSHLFEGTERVQAKRYFQPLALRLSRQCLTLPANLRPWRLERWLKNGWSFEQAVARQFFLYTPFLHSIDIDDQAMQHGLIENYRVAVETELGIIDPGRAAAGSIAHDPTLFMKVHKAGPPQGEVVKMEDYVFWAARKADCLLTRTREISLQKRSTEEHNKSNVSRT